MTETSPAARWRAAILGAGAGIAWGFAVWAFAVRLADVPYHYGNSDVQADVVRQACIDAGWLWFASAVSGAAFGGVAGALLATYLERIAQAAAASSGLYVLALRGGWGYDGAPSASAPGELPAQATALPIAIAAFAIAGLWRQGRRALEPDVSPADAASLSALHVCASLLAAHLTVQLPYYLGLRTAFGSGLGDLLRLVF